MAIRSSEISKTEYEVFLSFRGPDTRQVFTDVLYDHLKESGIQVFKDDDELAIGDTIEMILDAIKNSKICVPIFSKTFASSAWCLREVAKMVELNKEIVPIFYDVTPDDVKLKTTLYVEQMKKYERGQVEEWEKPLMEVGKIKGRELEKTGFVEFSKKFTAEIALKLRVKQKYTIKHFVKMPDEVEEAIELLETELIDVRILGMYGMGGIGKTTLAKIIFNRISDSFDSCSFLSNIREERSSKGLESLRTKLLHDLNHKASNCNISDNWDDMLERCVRVKSVLIVLDDVGERSHIEELVGDSISFGSRSRIIITTRDKNALLTNDTKASSNGEGSAKMSTRCITQMEVKGMNPEQAMQLFSRHAFGSDFPPKDYSSLSWDVISISGGLPLALEVIGSLLYGMGVEAWKDKVTLLKTIPAKNVQEKLMISYNTLEDNVKEIFLDIACFFIDEKKSKPIYMWEACGFGPNWAIQVLLSMSLVKITDDGTFWMHDQLRDLGREIVRIKGNNIPTSREGSRIQSYEDVLSVKKRNKEKEVVGLRLHRSDANLPDFSNLESLRFLEVLGNVTHHRKFWQLSTNLAWLSLTLNKPNFIARLRTIFSPVSRNRYSSYLMKLAVLDLSCSSITDSWDGWILIQDLGRLKVLNLTGCQKITRTPNFSKMEVLEELSLRFCGRLVKLDRSIGKLRKLKYLYLECCYKLKVLPEEVGNLEDLERINLSYTCVFELPCTIGKLKNLRSLHFESALRLKKLPATIGLLIKLKHLKLSSSDLNKLPDLIGDLISLISLDLSESHMLEELPSSITRLEKLERLTLKDCSKLVKLPEELGNLESLVVLDISGTSVVVLPESIGGLVRLQVINLKRSTMRVLPGTVAQLSLLQKLDLSECDRIERFSEFPTSLTDLNVNVCSMGQTLDLSKLIQLKELTLSDRSKNVVSPQQEIPFKFDEIGKLLSLEILEVEFERHFFLPVEFSVLTRLKTLKLSCSKLVYIPPFPSSLRSLTLSKLGRHTTLPCLSNLTSLFHLHIEDCAMEGGILNCGVDRLESLIELIVIYCDTIEKFPDLSRLKYLENLELRDCEELVEIPGLGALISLKRLEITCCDSLQRLESIMNLRSLRQIDIQYCKNLREIVDFEKLSVPSVSIKKCKCKDYVSKMEDYLDYLDLRELQTLSTIEQEKESP